MRRLSYKFYFMIKYRTCITVSTQKSYLLWVKVTDISQFLPGFFRKMDSIELQFLCCETLHPSPNVFTDCTTGRAILQNEVIYNNKSLNYYIDFTIKQYIKRFIIITICSSCYTGFLSTHSLYLLHKFLTVL